MAFLMSYRPFPRGPATPPEARRGGWPHPVDAMPTSRWRRNGEGRTVRRWVLESPAEGADPPF
jgi:hypothetical protein